MLSCSSPGVKLIQNNSGEGHILAVYCEMREKEEKRDGEELSVLVPGFFFQLSLI